jgi:hypothetical protein
MAGVSNESVQGGTSAPNFAALRQERLVLALNRVLAEVDEAISRAEFAYAEVGSIGDHRADRVVEVLALALSMRPGSLRHIHQATRTALRALVDG